MLAAEVDVSVRTVRRDIADLVDANVNIELASVDGEPGVRLIERGYATVPITTRELFTLFAVRSVFDVLRGTPLHDDVLSVLHKLEQRLDPEDAARHRRMGERIAYVPDGGTKAYDDKEDIIDALQTGILSHKVVRYAYKDSRGRNQRGHLGPTRCCSTAKGSTWSARVYQTRPRARTPRAGAAARALVRRPG